MLPILKKLDSKYDNSNNANPGQPSVVAPMNPEIRNAILANIVDSSLFGYNIGQVAEVPIYNLQAMRDYINSDPRSQKLGKHSKIDSNYQRLVSGQPIAALGSGKELNDELYEYINAMYYGIRLQSKHPQWRRAANLQAPNAAISNENQGNQNLGENELYPDKLDGDLNNPVHLETVSNSRKRRALVEVFAENEADSSTDSGANSNNEAPPNNDSNNAEAPPNNDNNNAEAPPSNDSNTDESTSNGSSNSNGSTSNDSSSSSNGSSSNGSGSSNGSSSNGSSSNNNTNGSNSNSSDSSSNSTNEPTSTESRELYELTRIITVTEAVLQSVTNVTTAYAGDNKYYTTQSMVYLCHLYALYLLSYDPLYYREILNTVNTSSEPPAPSVANIIERWSYNPLAILYGLYNGQTYSAIAKNAEHQELILLLNRNQTIQPYQSVEGFSVDNVYLKNGIPRIDLIALGLDNFFVHHFHRANRVARAYRALLPYRRFNYASSALLHNKSDFAAPGFFGDVIELKHDFSTKYSTLYPGLASLPSVAFLRFYTDAWVFAKRGFKLGQERLASINADTDRRRNLIANCIFRPLAVKSNTVESIKFDRPLYGMIVEEAGKVPDAVNVDADASNQKAYSLVFKNYGFLYTKNISATVNGLLREDIWVCDSEKMLIRHVLRVSNAADGTANIANGILYHYPAASTNINETDDKLTQLPLNTAPSFCIETIFNLATGKAKSVVLADKDITLQFTLPFALTTTSVKTADTYNSSAYVVVETTDSNKEVVGVYSRSGYKAVTDGNGSEGFKVLTLINVSYKWPAVLAVKSNNNDSNMKYYRLDPRNFYQYTPIAKN